MRPSRVDQAGDLTKRLAWSIGLSARRDVGRALKLIGEERPLFIVGPVGLEHEAIGSAIHEVSTRSRRPFVVINGSRSTLRHSSLAAARGGTVFVDLTTVELSGDVACALLGIDGTNVRGILAAHDEAQLRGVVGVLADGPAVRLRALSERPGDVPELLAAMLQEAGYRGDLASLGAQRVRGLTRTRWARNLETLRAAVPRLGAYLETGSLRATARVLGVSHQAMDEFFGRLFGGNS